MNKEGDASKVGDQARRLWIERNQVVLIVASVVIVPHFALAGKILTLWGHKGRKSLVKLTCLSPKCGVVSVVS